MALPAGEKGSNLTYCAMVCFEDAETEFTSLVLPPHRFMDFSADSVLHLCLQEVEIAGSRSVAV